MDGDVAVFSSFGFLGGGEATLGMPRSKHRLRISPDFSHISYRISRAGSLATVGGRPIFEYDDRIVEGQWCYSLL